jgi:threonine dehydrogenase-like Zn-dependent dehydrogenase
MWIPDRGWDCERACEGAGVRDSVVVIGLGGVGLSAIMVCLIQLYTERKWKSSFLSGKAAKIQGCHTVIGIDRVKARLELAKELGATHVIDTTGEVDLLMEIKEIIGGAGSTITIDTSGVPDLIKSGLAFTAFKGQMIVLGIPPRGTTLGLKSPHLWPRGSLCLVLSREMSYRRT